MPAERRPGYDHPHLAIDHLVDRPARRLVIDGENVAVAVTPLLLLEVYEDPLPDWPQLRSVAGGLEREFPNISRVSTREYGHRIGIFRLVDLLTDRGIRPVVAIDAMTAEQYPFLVEWLVERDVEWVAHGLSLTRPIGDHLDEEAENAYLAESFARLRAAGVNSTGWFGPEYGESRRTPALLAARGLRYVADWCGDEQPITMTVPTGSLTSYPLNADLDDQTTMANRLAEPATWGRHLRDAVTQLAVDGTDSARVLAFAVRPWLTGQPFRTGFFEDFLDHSLATAGARFLTPTQVLDAIETVDSCARPGPRLLAEEKR